MRPFLLGTIAIIAISVLVVSPAPAQTTLSVYLSAPKSTATIFSSTTTETFESLTPGNRTTNFSSAIGTYHLSASAPFAVVADNEYGNGTGKYVSIGAQSGTSDAYTLTFTTPQAYFGFSWDAGDPNNGLTFYRGSTFLGRFSTADITDLLSEDTVTTLDNTIYSSSEYYGKPGTGQNDGEPYSFVNFIANGGVTFDRIVFDNSGLAGSGFESDNHTIRTFAPAPDGKFVFVTQVTDGTVAPEPASVALLGLALPLAGLVRRRKI